jgi:hypothetical protein
VRAATERELKLRVMGFPPAEIATAGTHAIDVPLTFSCRIELWSPHMWSTFWDDLSEVVWLASVIGGLSAVGVGLAVALAAV